MPNSGEFGKDTSCLTHTSEDDGLIDWATYPHTYRAITHFSSVPDQERIANRYPLPR